MLDIGNLSPIGLTGYSDFSLNIAVYEKELNQALGENLSQIDGCYTVNDSALNLCKQLVPTFEGYLNEYDLGEVLRHIYGEEKFPCSIKLNHVEELEKMVLDTYKVSYMHYILGRKYNMSDSFPDGCCIRSSGNLAYALMYLGYPCAMSVESKFYHRYVILPFICEKEKGVILVDPTSDQLWKNYENKPKNMVTVFFGGNEWDYITPWENWANLKIKEVEYFPAEFEDITAEDLLKKAYSNPIKIEKIKQLFRDLPFGFGC